MTKKQLRQYRKIKKELQQVRDRMEETKSLLESPKVPKLTGMPFNAPAICDPMAETICLYIKLQSIQQSCIDRLLQAAIAIETAIESLEESTERQLLRARYLQGLEWYEVADAINYSVSQTHEYHKSALIKLARKGRKNVAKE